jgi:aldehyde:ferredoxin oxidoreductase
MHAAEALGTEAQNCGIYTMKGYSPRTHDHRAMWREMFDTATSDLGTFDSGYIGPPDPDVPSLKNGFSPDEVSANVAVTKGRRQFEDTLGTCIFCTLRPLNEVLEALNAATGWDFTPNEAQDVGFRVANLMRAFNLRHGVAVDVESTSPRWSSAPVDGPAKGVSIAEHWDSMLDNYYRLMGWDRETGRPLPETLKSIGLEHVTGDLWE